MINKEEKKELIHEFGEVYNPDVHFLNDYYDAFVGMVERINLGPIACYDVEKIVEILMYRDGMTFEDAHDFFDYNIVGSWVGENTPCFLNRM